MEINGAVSLLNASPLGESGVGGLCQLKVSVPAGGSSKLSDLEDIELEFYMVGQPIIEVWPTMPPVNR